jgi:phosphoglycolate phosphatase
MPRRFDLVVFDWDGTIVDSTTMIAVCIQKAAADLGLAVPAIERARHVIGLGLHDALARAVPELTAARIDEFTARYRHHWFACEPDVVLFAGMHEMLVDLAARGVPLAVATGKSRRGLARAFEQTGLGTLFGASRCADETHPKPHPAMLLELAEETGVAATRIVMIGDTTHDLEMAAAARTAAIGVTYGAHPREQLAALGPLALAADVAELRGWLQANG